MYDGMQGGGVVFLTGATGFVGKVVLEQLLRERAALGLERVYVFIRAESEERARERFEDEIVASRCFVGHPSDLYGLVEPVMGDMTKEGCGLSVENTARLCDEVSHVIHCAASVEFDLPLAQALEINVDGALRVLDLASHCSRLESMVSVSTAYVTPHRGDDVAIREELPPLDLDHHPQEPETLYAALREGMIDEAAFLRDSGHPNTYTFTKCLAEHLLSHRSGDLPLTLVRPSIVSASRQHPEPGWIDSPSAFAAFVLMLGTGYLQVVAARPSARLDIIPVDEVSSRVVSAAFGDGPAASDDTRVRHAVAGVENGLGTAAGKDVIVDFFTRHPVKGGPRVAHLGEDAAHGGRRFELEHWLRHRAVGALAITWLRLTRQSKTEGRARQLLARQITINRTFSYFTHNTFDFRSTVPMDSLFDAHGYAELSCRGVYQNLMGQSPQEVPFAGRSFSRRGSHIRWAFFRDRDESLTIRFCAYVLVKILDRCASRISFDPLSFDAATRALPEGHLPIVLPSHRSYLDFLLVPFLFFSRPDLGIPMPYIAADIHFSRIPILGRIAKAAKTFFLERGQGREDPELTNSVQKLVDEGQSVLFFIEGARSRSRRALPPKRGLIRSLQTTGARFVALPVSIDFDRVPEEATFAKELAGGPDRGVRLGVLAKWLWRLARGKIDIGSVHITCGEPIPFDSKTDRYALSTTIVRGIRSSSVISTYHLQCFLDGLGHSDLDLDFMRWAIEWRGGRIVESRLKPDDDLGPRTELSMRDQWMYLFYPEAHALFGEDPALRHFLARNEASVPESSRPLSSIEDPRTKSLFDALFEPVALHYREVARVLEQAGPAETLTVLDVMAARPGLYRPYVEDALAYATESAPAQ